MSVVKKLWGREKVITNNRKYCMKVLELDSGFESSLHYHKKKDETFLCIKGQVLLEYGPKGSECKTTILLPDCSMRLVPGTIHRFRAIGEGARIVEASTHHNDKDVVRLEPSRKL